MKPNTSAAAITQQLKDPEKKSLMTLSELRTKPWFTWPATILLFVGVASLLVGEWLLAAQLSMAVLSTSDGNWASVFLSGLIGNCLLVIIIYSCMFVFAVIKAVHDALAGVNHAR